MPGPPRRCTATGRSRGRFIAERVGVLARLPSYPAAVQGLATLPDLPAYLQARGRRTPGPDRRSQADAALQAFLTAVWTEATEFTLRPDALRARPTPSSRTPPTTAARCRSCSRRSTA